MTSVRRTRLFAEVSDVFLHALCLPEFICPYPAAFPGFSIFDLISSPKAIMCYVSPEGNEHKAIKMIKTSRLLWLLFCIHTGRRAPWLLPPCLYSRCGSSPRLGGKLPRRPRARPVPGVIALLAGGSGVRGGGRPGEPRALGQVVLGPEISPHPAPLSRPAFAPRLTDRASFPQQTRSLLPSAFPSSSDVFVRCSSNLSVKNLP